MSWRNIKSRLKLIAATFALTLGFCCAPLQPTPEFQKEPSLPASVESNVEDDGIVGLFMDVLAESSVPEHTNIALAESSMTPLASVGCSEQLNYCVVSVNVPELVQIRAKYGVAPLVFILGHELAHINQFATGRIGSEDQKMLELEADMIGACVTKRLGYKGRAVQAFIEAVFGDGDAEHYGYAERLVAWETGFSCE